MTASAGDDRSRTHRLISRLNSKKDEALASLISLRGRNDAVDFAGRLYERDRLAHASVLGSAVALRLFLFLIPATVAISSVVELLPLNTALESHLASTAATGQVALVASEAHGWRIVSLLVSGFLLTLMAGYSLTKVLVTSTATSWRMDLRHVRTRILTVLALSGILFAAIAGAAILSVVREHTSFVATSALWFSVAAVASLAWFCVMLTLPRSVNDPGALLPGAIVFGIANTLLQSVMKVYLPNKISRTTDTFGGLAATVAVLGYFFFVGRLMTSTFLLNAVTYERFGSLSQLFFGIPGLRRLPLRYPRLARYFSLDSPPQPQTPTAEQDHPS